MAVPWAVTILRNIAFSIFSDKGFKNPVQTEGKE